jgi:hypothetical protein
MKMDVICLYCKTHIRTIESNLNGASNGVCRNCLPKLVKDLGQPLSEFIDELNTPILIVREDMRVVAANAAARALSPEPLEELVGLLCGEVIGCLHSREEGGCGKTVHCLSCAIRKCVTYTSVTGQSCFDVPAYPDIGLLSGNTDVRFRVSTGKKRDFVLLRIEQVEEAPQGDPSTSDR